MADFKKDPPSGQPSGSSSVPDDDFLLNPSAEEFFKRFQSEMRRPQPAPEAIAAMQRLAAESVGDAGSESQESFADPSASPLCSVCGHKNRPGSRFCGMCGLPIEIKSARSEDASPTSPTAPSGPHHYHHHYHHHYFSSSPDFSLGGGRAAAPESTPPREAARFRAPGTQQVVSRAEAAVRKVTQDWAVACNSRQLDDLVSTYAMDAIVMRPNHPAVRGAPAIREFFFTALDAGLGEVELDILRVDVVGEMAYEAGRCKMLVPTAIGKRREERGKYLMVLSRQSNAEWRIIADCWSSDLSLSAGEADAPKASGPMTTPARPPAPRKP
jgi:ketosteroid isomerase-like protein